MPDRLGKQLLVDYYECDCDRLDDEGFLVDCCVSACKALGATVMGTHSHRYTPQGVSVVVVLAESHLSLHTWPEHGMASVDIFLCNAAMGPAVAKASLAADLGAGRTAEVLLTRGRLDRTASPIRAHAFAESEARP